MPKRLRSLPLEWTVRWHVGCRASHRRLNPTTMKHNSSKGSRKASQVRGERVSKPNQSHEVIKLGVDTHSQQYTFARMVDHQGIQPAQKLSPAAFIEFLKKQLTLAKRVVMVYEAG